MISIKTNNKLNTLHSNRKPNLHLQFTIIVLIPIKKVSLIPLNNKNEQRLPIMDNDEPTILHS